MSEEIANKLLTDNWSVRRRVVICALLYIGFNVSWILLYGRDTALNSQIALALIMSGSAIVGSYVFGATWDDHNKRNALPTLSPLGSPLGGSPYGSQGSPYSAPTTPIAPAPSPYANGASAALPMPPGSIPPKG